MSEPIATHHCLNRDDVKNVGDYWINRIVPERPMIMIMMPKDTIPAYLRLYPSPVVEGGEDKHYWTLTGTDDCPTLSPSLDHPGVWHGHLTEGKLIEA